MLRTTGVEIWRAHSRNLCVGCLLVFLLGCGAVTTVTVEEVQNAEHSTTFLLDKPLGEIIDEMEEFAQKCDSVRPEIIPKVTSQEPLTASSASCFMTNCYLYYELSERPGGITHVKASAINEARLNDAPTKARRAYQYEKVCEED